MGTKQSNFKTALNELMAGKLSTDETSATDAQQTSMPTSAQAAAPIFKQTPTVSYQPQNVNTSILAKDLIIEGNIKSKSAIRIDGHIIGNVNCDGAIACTGAIDGDVKCESLMMAGCSIHGNIDAKADVAIDPESLLIGNIKASNLCSNGRIKGNLTVASTATLKEQSLLLGDVSANSIILEAGSALKGAMEVHSSSLTEDTFQLSRKKDAADPIKKPQAGQPHSTTAPNQDAPKDPTK